MSITIKQGQSFIVNGSYKEDDKITPKSLAGITLTSKIRDSNDIVLGVFVITITDTVNGLYTMALPEGTTNTFPVGKLYWDIFETVAGKICATDTQTIVVKSGISRN